VVLLRKSIPQNRNLKSAAELNVSKYKENKLEYTLARNQPEIIGQLCEGFYLMQHQFNFEISELVNVAYFKFSHRWVRLYFEPLMVFWGEGDAPLEPINTDLENLLVLVNLNEMNGIVGSVLKSVEYGVKENNVLVSLAFESGKTLVFAHSSESDATSIHC